eukprot:6192673-Pleurochrysis_carterae.AAC.2
MATLRPAATCLYYRDAIRETTVKGNLSGALGTEIKHGLGALQRGTTRRVHGFEHSKRKMCDALPTATTETHLSMACKAILHAQKGAEVPVTARDTGQAGFECPEPVLARAAI